MFSPGHSGERSTYSPSLACVQRFRPGWIDARSGCRFSAADRQTIRDRAKSRNTRGVVVDRYPAWKGHGESFSVTKFARPKLAAQLLAQHESRPRPAPVDPARLRLARKKYALAEIEESILCGFSDAKLKAHLASDPLLRQMMRDLIALSEA